MGLWEIEKEQGRCGQTSVAIAATAAQEQAPQAMEVL